MKREHILIIGILIFGALLRFYALNSNYVHILDSYGRLSETLSIIKLHKFSYGFIHSPGLAMALVPFALISPGVMMNQIGIAVYGVGTIYLSYVLIKLYFPEYKYARLLFPFLVAVNPMLIALSKNLLYDVVLLFFVLLVLILAKVVSERRSIALSSLLGVLLVFSVFQKPTNLILFPLVVLFVVAKRTNCVVPNLFTLKKNKDVLIGIAVFVFLFMIYLVYFQNIKGAYTSFGGTAFFEKNYYYQNIVATVKSLMSPLNLPATGMYFAAQAIKFSQDAFLRIFLGISEMLFVGIGFLFAYNQRKAESIFLGSVAILYPLFFLNYTNWVLRHQVVTATLLLLFLSFGLEALFAKMKFKEKTKKSVLSYFSVLLLISFSFSCYSVYELEAGWNEEESFSENFIVISPEEGEEVVNLALQQDVSLIIGPYGMWFDYYVLKDNLDIQIIDTFRGYSESQIIAFIHDTIEKNERAWYVKGWPDGYYKGGSRYFDAVSNKFLLAEIMSGEILYRDVNGVIQRSLIVYEIGGN